MDGVRAYWNREKLITRHGKDISAPGSFTKDLPRIELDGELWVGQGSTYSDVIKILNSKNSDWSPLGYFVFDIPSSVGTYEERMVAMNELKTVLPSHIHIVENIQCSGNKHLLEHLSSILGVKGEGLVLRKSQTPYVVGYTSSILKVKVSEVECIGNMKEFEDTEVKMLATVDGGLLCQQYILMVLNIGGQMD